MNIILYISYMFHCRIIGQCHQNVMQIDRLELYLRYDI